MHHHFETHSATLNGKDHPGFLDVILVVSNTRRFESRYRLFKKILDELKATPNIRVTTVETAFGRRPFHIADPSSKQDILFSNYDELFHKENMINLGIQRLPMNWKYVCWMDADIGFINYEKWATETIESLQHHMIVQPWSHAIDLGPDGETFAQYNSFGYCYETMEKMSPDWKPYGRYQHTGYCWAARREAIDYLGGLMDFAILGSADHHMAWSLIGMANKTFPPNAIMSEYRGLVYDWQDRALRYIQKDIGFVPGTIYHYWHGKKKDRKYKDRWETLIKYDFNPRNDLVRDWQGLWRLRVENDRQIGLRDGIRKYFKGRFEDSSDLE